MLTLALIILALAAAGGAFLGLRSATGHSVPAPMRHGHGLFAAVGVLIFLIGAWGAGSGLVWLAFALNAAGLAGGALLFGVIYTDRKPPGTYILGHGGLNIAGVLVLAYALLG